MKNTIIKMLQASCSYDEIIEAVGCSRPAISYHARRLGLSVARSASLFDWKVVAEFYEDHTYTETLSHFKISASAWYLAIKRGDIVTRGISDRTIPLEQILIEHSAYVWSNSLRQRLVRENILENVCCKCNQLPFHNDKPLVLQLDHINGINNDNRLENLRILCPNCHTQTPTWGQKNRNLER